MAKGKCVFISQKSETVCSKEGGEKPLVTPKMLQAAFFLFYF